MPLARWGVRKRKKRPEERLDENPWQISAGDFPASGTSAEQLRFLIRYAILAPSSHNSQPWRFSAGDGHVDILIDANRWLKVADDDQRELHISLGCALENLLIAAEHFGFAHEVTYFPDGDGKDLVASVHLRNGGTPAPHRPPVLFNMIAVRHTNHTVYDNRTISGRDLDRLRKCCVEDGISLYLTSAVATRKKIDELIVRGDLIQFSDPAFRKELGYWIGEGVFGTPPLISKLAKWTTIYINLGRSQSQRDSELVMSSPVFGIFGAREDDRTIQIKIGQVFERMSLLGASMGIWNQPMSQIVEIPELREEVAKLIPEPNVVPEHPFRLGYAIPQVHTPRRPLSEVVV
jgi:hypothetical protein